MAKKQKKTPVAPDSPSDADIDAAPPAAEAPAADAATAPAADAADAPAADAADAAVAAAAAPDVATAADDGADALVAEVAEVAAEVPVDPRRAVEMLGDVELDVKVELGRCQMLMGDVLRLSAGSVVELDKLAGDPVDVCVNERLVARGEVLVVNDNFCVRINEVLAQDD